MPVQYIAHRINTLEELRQVPEEYGIEIDIRDGLLVVHDPFCEGIDLEDLLKEYHHQFIILNIKCERIEYKIMELLDKYQIKNYFFLDSSFPMIYKLSGEGNKNIALRYSEFEQSILPMTGKCDWVWIDSFNDILSLDQQTYQSFKQAGFKLCFVSPELHGYDKVKIDQFATQMQERGIQPDMICTKIYNINRWQNYF